MTWPDQTYTFWHHLHSLESISPATVIVGDNGIIMMPSLCICQVPIWPLGIWMAPINSPFLQCTTQGLNWQPIVYQSYILLTELSWCINRWISYFYNHVFSQLGRLVYNKPSHAFGELFCMPIICYKYNMHLVHPTHHAQIILDRYHY